MASDTPLDVLRRHVSPGMALGAKLTGTGAVEESADGATVRLSDGRELIDFGSYGVTLLGHRHPAVVEAVAAQLDRMPATSRVLANPATTALVARLVDALGAPLERVWLGSDGADAIEVALKLARKRTGRLRVLAVERGFHGKTLGALSLTWNPPFRLGLEPLLGHVTHVDPSDPEAVARECAKGDVAAIVFEPIQGEAGVRPLATEVLRRWCADAHAAGAYAIADEIQTGMRRCGPLSLARAAELDVDAVLLGKALGGGVLPVAALVATPELHEPLAADPTFHSATFGGHPLGCAAAVAALDAVDELADHAAFVGERVGLGLRAIAAAHPRAVTAVRGCGLLWGIEVAAAGVAGNMLIELAQNGLIVSPCLSAPRAIRLLPPMVATADEVDRALEAFDAALAVSDEYVDEEDDAAVAPTPAAPSNGRPMPRTASGRVVIVDPIDPGAVDALRQSFDVVVRMQPPQEELEELVCESDVVILRSGVRMTAATFERAERLKVVARAGMGVDNVDLDAARQAGVTVFNVPGESAWAVAEFTFGLMMAVARRIAQADAQVRVNAWNKAALLGTEMRGKTIGIVGCGNVGSKLAELTLAVGMRVLTCLERPTEARREVLAARGVELVGFDRIVTESDVLCLTVPLTDATRGMVDRAVLERMKRTAYLVNIARSAVCNEADLYDALRDGTIAGAAIDVLGEERKPTRFAELENVVLTPHIAAMTDTSQERIGRIVVERIHAALNGAAVENRLC